MSRSLFLCLIVLGFSALVFSEEYSSGISSFFEDSSSSSILESSSNPFPIESSSSERECYPGEYRNGNTCEKCSQALNCGNCSNGHSCDSCKSEDFTLVNGRCEVNCENKFKKGCSSCTEKKCLACNAQECCTEMKHRWVDNKCQKPEEAFGKGCIEANSTHCTLCTAQECCLPGTFFNYDVSRCEPCTAFGENCQTCTFGMCLTCGEGEIVKGGNCQTCADVYNTGCQTCNTFQCLTAAEGYIVQGSKATPCSDVFGASCTKCGENGCEECSVDTQKPIGGFCKTCSMVFGEKCTDCNSEKCTQCSDGSILVNGVCVTCQEAFGDSCAECKEDFTGCKTAAENQGFIFANFAFKCEALPEGAGRNKCTGQGTRNTPSAPARYARDATMSVEYDGQSYEIQCSAMTEHCANCEVKEGNAVCTACEDGYVLFGGYCKLCSEQHDGYNCATCSQTGCTSCDSNLNHNINAEGKCVACEDGKIFEADTKTCMDCDALYSNCQSCAEGACATCIEGYVLIDGKCKPCSEKFKDGCSKCTADKCTDCKSASCCNPGESIVIENGASPTCGQCSSAFGDKCKDCTASTCTACVEGFATDDDSNCVACSELFEGCSACDADQCTKCSEEGWKVTPNGCYKDETTPDAPVKPTPSSEPEKESKAGMIVGIVIGCIALIAIVAIAIYCFATAGAKRGKIDPVIYEEDPEFVSMSVL